MPLLEPDQEDVRKLHAEINQINNQRFLLTTGAITTFGVIISLIWKEAPKPNDAVTTFPLALAAILSIVLFCLYLINHILRLAARTYAIYLAETGKSNYELEFPNFRPRSVYQIPQTLVFLVLNALGMIFPSYVLIVASLTWETSGLAWFALGIATTAELLILLWGFCRVWDNDKKVRARLRILKAKP